MDAHVKSLVCISDEREIQKNGSTEHSVYLTVEASDLDKDFQQFLDNVQYKCTGILRYERVFGEGYVSTGGFASFVFEQRQQRNLLKKLELKPGQKVLDVGCGIGGGDLYMPENFDIEVVGINLSVNMVSFALERAVGHKCSVEFEVADCTKTLFRNFFKWLKPGGKVLVSDYCKSPGPPSADFGEYIKQRGYDLHDVEAYGQMLKDTGFVDVTAEGQIDQFMKVLQRELDVVEDKEKFIADFSEADYNDIVGGWNAKLVRTASGEQRWGLFFAKKK
ncbi:hypothetical protein MKX01_008846 [Papaver californicum]|nr:hypothetical protein MKX01_008846 [Papaver californicum]